MRLTTSKSDNAFSGKTFYGGFIEWGRKVGKRRRISLRRPSKNDTSDTRKKVPPNSFMKRAAQRTRTTALRLYANGILEYIRKVTKK